MRDRADADVHILITSEGTGGGGRAYAVTLIGLRRFAGRADTLRCFSPQAATDDATRAGVARLLRLGLVGYVLNTPDFARLDVSYDAPDEGAPAERTTDPWNYWVFEVQAQGRVSGESAFNSVDLEGGAAANRTTAALKVEFQVDAGYERQRFEIDSSQTIVSTQEFYGAEASAIRSLGPHFGAGAQLSARRSTFRNQSAALRAAAAVEWNLFPYVESARRLLTVQYQVGAERFSYFETTIFGRDNETLLDHSLEARLDATQPWGQAGVDLRARQYLDDLKKNSLRLSGGVEVNLVRGLALELDGSISRVRDQRYLPSGGLTPEEVLLRQQEIATDYRYFISAGLSYSFGSIFNNIINPRFDRGF